MELSHPWLRFEFFGLVDECRFPSLAIVAHESPEFAKGLCLSAELVVEDMDLQDEALLGFWCYDRSEAEHVHEVAERLHAVLSGNWSRGRLVPIDHPAWRQLVEASQTAWIAFARRGMPAYDFPTHG